MAERFVLENGLTVVFEPQRTSRVAAFQIWVKAGSADERTDQAGLAHLHEHMLFKGTRRRGPGEIAREIEAHGGDINAWTSFDQTVYHVVIASQFARVGLDVLADAVRHSQFDPAELAREIEVVVEEIKRSSDRPARRASRDLFSTAYRVHPYQRPVLGWEETVRSFSQEKVLEFYRRHYSPRNMVVTATGDLELERVREWTQELLGGNWSDAWAGPTERAAEPRSSEPRTLFRQDDAKEAYFNLAFPAPSNLHPDVPALDVMAMILGQGDASHLVRRVKRERSLVSDIRSYAYTPRDPGLITVSLTATPEHLAAAVEEMARTVVQITRQLVDADELATVKSIIESEGVYERETVQGVARKLGYFESLGSLDDERRYYERVAAVTSEQVLDVAERYLRFDSSTMTALLPSGTTYLERDALDAIERARSERPPPNERKIHAVAAPTVVPAVSRSSRRSGIIVEKLPSGAQLVIREERSVPLFAMRAAFLGGSRYETEADQGITTLLARMIHRGTATKTAEQITDWVDGMSGSLGGKGGRNSMGLRGEFLSRHFDRAFDLFADCLLEPSFPEAELAREKNLVLQELETRDDKPATVAYELLARLLYERHPYRFSSGGEVGTVRPMTREQLREFHQRYMQPSQLTLAVVGDVDADAVIERANKAFGHDRATPSAPPDVPQEQPHSGPRESRRVLTRAQAHIVLGFPGVRVTEPKRRALEVLTTILSGQGGRLFVELRDKKSLAYSLRCASVEGLDPGYVSVYIATSPEKVNEALTGIRAELDKVRQEPVTRAELSRAREHLIGTHEIGLQRNGARAGLLALDQCYGLGLENFTHYSERVSAVTADDVLRAARETFDEQRMALAIVGP